MKEIKNLITSDEIDNYDMDDRFIMVLTKFHKTAQSNIKKYNMIVGNVMVSTKRVMKKFSYGTEESPQTIESFFQIWWNFLQAFDEASKTNTEFFFIQLKSSLHGKLRDRANGGKIDDTTMNRMHRLSSMYQDQQSRLTVIYNKEKKIKEIEEAKKKAAIYYNKFRLPDNNKKRKWNVHEWDKQPFDIPDSKPMAPPKRNPQSNPNLSNQQY
eukprot:445204_1